MQRSLPSTICSVQRFKTILECYGEGESAKGIAMTLRELEQQVQQLSVDERLSLLNTIARSLQHDLNQSANPELSTKRVLVDELRGCLKRPGELPPTDQDIEAMREERLVEKYLK